jgi:hypothetical protein
MKDVEEIATDTNVVFGSVKVYEDDELQKWGVKFFGSNYFYLTILPPDSNEAITYKLAKNGTFFWSLPPGEYKLLGYHWQNESWQRTGYIDASFSVPDSGADTYLGTIEFRGNMVLLVPHFQDEFDDIVKLYDAKFPERKGTAIKQLFEPPQSIGNVVALRGQCHDAWGIECDKRFSGVTPTSPRVSQSGFPSVDTLKPEFRWNPSARQDITYDLIIYEAAAYAFGGMTTPLYMKGRVVAYEEGIRGPYWQPQTPLKPDARYIWSVRLREGNTVSRWSTQSHSTFLLVYMSSGFGQWFQFRTAVSPDMYSMRP